MSTDPTPAEAADIAKRAGARLSRRNLAAALSLTLGLVATVALANWATSTFGLVTALLPGLAVTAGTYAAGLGLVLRDGLHDIGGARWTLAAIAVGIALSLAVGDERVAIASATAFALGMTLDLAVYGPLRRRAWRTAVVASSAVGGLADSVVFLAVAGFPVTAATVGGQLFVKAVVITMAYLLVVEGVRGVHRHVIGAQREAAPR